MIHMYKSGGDRIANNGFKYSILAVGKSDIEKRLNEGWHRTLELADCIEAEPVKPKKAKS